MGAEPPVFPLPRCQLCPFLADNFKWYKKSPTVPFRGLTPDGEKVSTTRQHNACQKCLHLELMLGQIAKCCPVISRNTIVKNSRSVNSIWDAIRTHYSFQFTGTGLLGFSNIKLEVDEGPEDLFQWLMSFTKDNLLVADSTITHHGATITVDELTPTPTERWLFICKIYNNTKIMTTIVILIMYNIDKSRNQRCIFPFIRYFLT